MKFDTVGFIGLGLIGGSIARKLKQNNPNTRILATARHADTIDTAFSMQLIDNDRPVPISDFSECDTIFLCAPVKENISYLKELKQIIRPDCMITDVGSTKGDIHKAVCALSLEANFIGGHPMTGSEKTGIRNADPSILVNAYYIITPTAISREEDVEDYRSFVSSLGAIPLILAPTTHDHATASISHLPHIIAYALVSLIRDADDGNETMKTIAAGGFKDITRIASSSPEMWQNICGSNREQILAMIDAFSGELSKIRELIDAKDAGALTAYFQTAKDYRDSLLVPSVRPRSAIHEIFIDLDDKAGELAIVSSMLGSKGISIKNIGIIHNREFEQGVLRVEFYDSEAAAKAFDLLRARNYKIYLRN